MFTGLTSSKSLFVAMLVAALAAPDALAKHGGGSKGGGGGGGGGSRGGHASSSHSGGGGGRSSSMRSTRSGGGGQSMKSWSGGGSKSSSAIRSSRSFGGNSGKSSWSGGGGGSKARSFSSPAWSGGKSTNQSSSQRARNFSGNNFLGNSATGAKRSSGSNRSGKSGNALQQYRAYRAQSGSESNRAFAGGSNTRQRATSDQLQQMFKKYHEQQAVTSSNSKKLDQARGRTWSDGISQGNRQAMFKQFVGANDGNRRSRSNAQGPGTGGDPKQLGNLNNLGLFRNSGGGDSKKWSGNGDLKQAFDNQLQRRRSGDFSNGKFAGGQGDKGLGQFSKGQFGRGNRGPGAGQFGRNGDGFNAGQFGRGDKGPGQFGKWSKKGNGDWNPRTARWFGNSGFGDHRGRGDGHDGNFDHQRANQVRHNWNDNWSNKHGHHDWNWYRGRGWRDVPFAYGWWGGRRNFGYCYYWNGWRNDPWYWWGACSAPFLTTWIDFGWNYPCYWDYGYGQDAYVTYYNNTVYVDGQRYATELDYYAQVRNLARSVPPLSQNQLAGIEWLPLGVFAVSRPGADQTNELMQLAVSKDGILSGTLFNEQTGQARPLQGMVDEATQKAAWTFADSPTDALVVETSLYNLTAPECTALAHLDAVNTEVWQLVQLKQPQPPGGPQPAPAGAVGAPAPVAKPVLPPQGAVN